MMRFLHMWNPAMWSSLTGVSVVVALGAENWVVSTIAFVAAYLILILSAVVTYTKAPEDQRPAPEAP